MTSLVERMDRSLYPNVEKRWDDQLFRGRILQHLRPEHVVLDVGAGSGRLPEMNFKGHVARICGVDLDPRVVENPFLDEGKVADAGGIPYSDQTFDLVFADNVMEHLEEPEAVLSEIRRVLKPGGLLLFKTPNATHYIPLIARLTPHKFHQFMNRLRGRSEVDTFPTRYKANTPGEVHRLAKHAGFEVDSIVLTEGRPEYLRIFAPLYLVGFLYERLVNSSTLFAGLRILLIAQLRRPGVATTADVQSLQVGSH
jgi:SAM-dependent methyltransferase